jgi:hypothetical protein
MYLVILRRINLQCKEELTCRGLTVTERTTIPNVLSSAAALVKTSFIALLHVCDKLS